MGKIIPFTRQDRNSSRGERDMTEVIREIRALPRDGALIKTAVDLILKKMGLTDKYPIPIVRIAQEMGFAVYQQPISDKNLSGYIAISGDLKERYPSDKIISVSQDESLGHKRFTIAHELAHFLFDFYPGEMSEYYDTYQTDAIHAESPEEKRANQFAAYLLMPEDIFNKVNDHVKVEGDLYETVNRLAKEFQVSATAARLHIDEVKSKQ